MPLFVDRNDVSNEFENPEKYINECSVEEAEETNLFATALEPESKGEYEKELKMHMEILEIRRKGSNITALADSLNTVGVLYMLMNDFVNSNKYFCEALKYRSLENDLIGYCKVHLNLSRMYYLQSLYTNESRYLNHSVWSLEIALKHLSQKSQPELYKDWETRYSILQAQMLRYSSTTSSENYRGVLSELTEFYDMIKENTQSEMLNRRMELENNIAVVLALMGENDKACELINKCLITKEIFKEIYPCTKSTSYNITKNNLKAIKQNCLQDLIFEY